MEQYTPEQIAVSQKVVDLLNDLTKHEQQTVDQLIKTRIPCGKYFDEHPYVQVMLASKDPEQCVVGFLGMLNGILTILGSPKIQAVWDGLNYEVLSFDLFRTRTPNEAESWSKQNLLGHKEK